jgi:DNA-binding NarL/FixJ family response regulator
MPINGLLDEDSGSSIILRSKSADTGPTATSTKQRTVLVIEDSDADFTLIEHALQQAVGISFIVEHAVHLSDGLERLASGGIHLVLLDLSLPDSTGLETFRKAYRHVPNVPIIVLSGLDDRSVAFDAVREGAQDYLVKGKLETDSLVRSISYARERHKTQVRLAHALQATKAGEANLHNIISSMVDGVLVIDGQGTVQFSNNAAQGLFGRTQDELQRVPIGLPLVVGQATDIDLLRNDGESVPVAIRTVEIDWEGKPAQLAMLHDLTRRKEAEADHLKRVEAEREISIANDVQQSLFPAQAPPLKGFDIAGAVFSAEQGSGDAFDFISMPDDNVCVVVADVSGHGLGPAMMMVQTRAYVRALASVYDDLGEILTRTNQHLLPNDHGRFVTMFLGRIDPRTRSFVFATAGHAGYRLTRNGDVTTLDAAGMLLGIMEDERFVSAPAIELEPGDIILLPTDGVPEAHAPDNTLFGVSRMIDVVRANRDKPAHEIVHAVYQAARDFSQGGAQTDDITVVVIKVE